MREIKFRIWNDMAKKMHYQDSKWNGSNGFISLVTIYTGYEDPSEWKNYFVMQSTGIDDASGTEIYEGDILKDEENFLWVVDWCRGSFYIYNVHVITCEPLLFDIYEDIEEGFEVIGNIYEKPELLEVEE